MYIQEFINQIPTIFLGRGDDYSHRGAIIDLNKNSLGTWVADVEGSGDEYIVEIESNENGEIDNYYCNCPYDGVICKLVAAVTLKLNKKV